MFGEKLPELPYTERLADIWQSLGCSGSGVNGPAPFTWQELQAYSATSQRRLQPAEADCLIEMSRAFVAALNDKRPLSIAPMERVYD